MSEPRAFVIGHPVAHSRSPRLHHFWLRDYGLAGRYEKIDVAPDDLPAFVAGLRAAGFAGGNVTVPHKTAIMALVDEVDAAARAIGAVNTLWFDGARLTGGNTDAIGFVASLDDEAPDWDRGGRHAVVLGAGGAARAVVHGLLGRGFEVSIANRTKEAAEAIAARHDRDVRAFGWDDIPRLLIGADLLVNTTSLGMVGKPPLVVDLGPLPPAAIVADLVYVPLETALLRTARQRGHRAIGGLGMLLHQGAPGFARWFGRTPVVTPALRAAIEADIAASG